MGGTSSRILQKINDLSSHGNLSFVKMRPQILERCLASMEKKASFCRKNLSSCRNLFRKGVCMDRRQDFQVEEWAFIHGKGLCTTESGPLGSRPASSKMRISTPCLGTVIPAGAPGLGAASCNPVDPCECPFHPSHKFVAESSCPREIPFL